MVTRTGIDPYTQRSNRQSRISMNGLPQRNMPKDRGTFKSYHKPIRSRSIPTDSAAKNLPFTPRSSSLLPIQRITEDEIYAIGLALGSPTHPPEMHAATWQAQTGRMATRTAGDQSPDKHGLSRSLSRKLNIFSRSKSRRGRDPEAASRQTPLDVSTSPKAVTSLEELSRRDEHRDGVEQRTPLRGPRPKHTPIIIPTHAEPIGSERIESKAPTPSRSLVPIPPPKDVSSPSHKSAVEVITITQDSAQSSHLQPMLDVEIPTVTLDRYSVMFGNVLRQKNTPSLLARRQATLERLQTVSENRPPENNLLRPQRPSSQVPKASPSFHLFPQSPGSRVNSPLAPPRSRANTSPAILPSPLRLPFEANEKKLVSSTETLDDPPSPTKDDKLETPQSGTSSEHPRLVSKFHRKKSASSVTGSPTTVISPSTTKQKLRNSSRQEDHIVFMSPSWKSKPSRPAASPEIVRSPKTPQTAAEKKPLDDPVEISIARQISISRQQRKMLEPFRSQEKLNRANSVAKAAARVTVGAGKRLAETKSATPKVVYMDPGNSEIPKRAHRASERVILEGV